TQHTAVFHIIHRSTWQDVSVKRFARVRGRGGRLAGIRVSDGFTALLSAIGSAPAGLVGYVHPDGYLYLDRRTLREVVPRLSQRARRRLLRHAEALLANARAPDHLRLPHWSLPPAPDMSALIPVVGARRPDRTGRFASFVDPHGRTVLVQDTLGNVLPDGASS